MRCERPLGEFYRFAGEVRKTAVLGEPSRGIARERDELPRRGRQPFPERRQPVMLAMEFTEKRGRPVGKLADVHLIRREDLGRLGPVHAPALGRRPLPFGALQKRLHLLLLLAEIPFELVGHDRLHPATAVPVVRREDLPPCRIGRRERQSVQRGMGRSHLAVACGTIDPVGENIGPRSCR